MLEYVRENTDYCTGACEREGTQFSALSLLKLYQWYFSVVEKPTEGVHI